MHFFEDVDPFFLSKVEAVAMDMNTSYHILVNEKLPIAKIVYDHYHMQAQYGKEVLGAVHLAEARKHSAASKELSSQLKTAVKKKLSDEQQAVKEQIQQEKQQYRAIKKLRWTLLTNGEKTERVADLEAAKHPQ